MTFPPSSITAWISIEITKFCLQKSAEVNLAAHKVVNKINKIKYGAPLNSVVNKYLLVTTKDYFTQKCKFCH